VGKPFFSFGFEKEGGWAMKRMLRGVSYLLASVYFLVDLVFAGIAKSISKWISRHLETRQLRDWIGSLRPYPCLALFSIPVILLEPIKFVAAYLAATGYFLYAMTALILGELLKLVMIERLFELTRKKLLRIPAFAFVYGYYLRARAWVMQTEAVRVIHMAGRTVVERVTLWRRQLGGRLSPYQS
jgi:hypothetical protein